MQCLSSLALTTWVALYTEDSDANSDKDDNAAWLLELAIGQFSQKLWFVSLS